MSDKSILQGHNEIIDNNNISIDELIESINNLQTVGSGTLEITENGTYDITEYASANVNVGSEESYNLGYSDGYLDSEASIINGQITSVVNDRVITIRQHAFYGLAQTLTYVYFKNADTVNTNAFYNCRALKKAHFDKVTSITANAFYLCSTLEELVIRTPSICSLSANLTNNGITLGKGYIYVPDELVEEYKVATNWSTYATQIKPLSELE